MRCCLVFAVLLSLAGEAIAGGPCSGVKGGCGRSRYRSSSSGGSVHVSGYTRKDGTYVSPHTRRSPCSGCGEDDSPSYRSTARSSVRTQAWGGTSSTYETDERALYAPVPDPETVKAQANLNEIKNQMARAQAELNRARKAREAEEELAKDMQAKRFAAEAERQRHRYVMHLKSGAKRDVCDYAEEAESYLVTTLKGGKTRYKKSLVIKFEPIEREQIKEGGR